MAGDRSDEPDRIPSRDATVDPEVIRAFATFAQSVTADLRRKVVESIQPVTEAYAAQISAALQPAIEAAAWAARQAGRIAGDALARTLPPNWDLTGGDVANVFMRRFELAKEGVVVAWVPRESVIVALEQAAPGRRPAMLVEHQTWILEDCRQALEVVVSDHEEFGLAGLALEALECAEAGQWGAAQALAVNVLESTIRQRMGKRPSQLRGETYEWGDAKTQYWFRRSMTVAAVQPALDTFPETGPIPKTINRNATVHYVVPEQYTRANALHALLLATSLLREVHAYRPN